MELQWHQQQQMRPCGCGAALSWTLHGDGSGKRPMQPKAASSTKASVENQLTSFLCFFFFFFFFLLFLIKSRLPLFSLHDLCPHSLPKGSLSTVVRELEKQSPCGSLAHPSCLQAGWPALYPTSSVHTCTHTASVVTSVTFNGDISE